MTGTNDSIYNQDPRWYCPFFTSVKRDRRITVRCEGGSRLCFERFRDFDAFADAHCRCEGYRDCSVARTRFARWGVSPDEC